MVIASYLLFRLGWGVFTFNDVPDAHRSLQAEIATAKKELRAMKVDVD
jgi:dolichyl-phosphate mannosyltransferase polypeptide 3